MAIKTKGPLPFLSLKTWGKEESLGAERELGEPAKARQTDVASAGGLQGGSHGAEHLVGAETSVRRVRHFPRAQNLRGRPKTSVIKIK